MLQGTQVHHKKRGRRGGKAVSAIRSSTSNHLTIPVVDPAIPFRVEIDPQSSRWASIALLWLDAGVLTEDDSGKPDELVRTALHRWMDTQLEGNVHLRHMSLSIHTYPSPHGSLPQDASAYDEPIDPTKWLFAVVGGVDWPWFTLEEKLTALEAAHPGLGKTAWHRFFEASCQTIQMLDPVSARGLAERSWWHYAATDEDFIDEMKCNDIDPEEIEVLLPSEFDRHFPDWVLQPSDALTNDDLAKIAKEGETEEAMLVAQRLLAMAELDGKPIQAPSLFGDSPVQEDGVYYLAYLRWNESDVVMRVADDYIEDANGSGDGYTDLMGADAVPLDAAQFLEWKSATENGFTLLRHMDGLLSLIGTPVNN